MPDDNAKTRLATDGRVYDPDTHQWRSEPAPPAPEPVEPAQPASEPNP